ncbi:MAG: FliH/SctL family protein [Vicinamibacterales bacterium]
MSSRAVRVRAGQAVQRFGWDGGQTGGALDPLALPDLIGEAPPAEARASSAAAAPAAAPAPPPAVDAAEQQAALAALERDAFSKGYAQGEKAGYEAGAKRAEAMLRRLSGTLDELAHLRTAMIQQTEQQMVQLALAIARRILRREVTLDADFVVAMARVALDRLGEQTRATVRLHPDDLAATGSEPRQFAGTHVTVVADASLSRGQCQVESEYGFIDVGVEAQFEQISEALIGDAQPVPVAAGAAVHAR